MRVQVIDVLPQIARCFRCSQQIREVQSTVADLIVRKCFADITFLFKSLTFGLVAESRDIQTDGQAKVFGFKYSKKDYRL